MTRNARRMAIVLLVPVPLLMAPVIAGIAWLYSLGFLGRLLLTPFVMVRVWLAPERTLLIHALGGLFWYLLGAVVLAALTARRDRLGRWLAVAAIALAAAIIWLGLPAP